MSVVWVDFPEAKKSAEHDPLASFPGASALFEEKEKKQKAKNRMLWFILYAYCLFVGALVIAISEWGKSTTPSSFFYLLGR